MASATSYQNFSPRALEPYPIESKLSELAYSGYGNSPAEAQTALDQYWFERQAHENLYGQEVAAQHEEARQNIAAQLYEQNIKGLTELGKMPGGLALARSSPYYRGVLGGASDDVLNQTIQQQQDAQNAVNFEKSGAGYSSYRHGGATLDLAGTPAGQYVTTQGPTSDVQSAIVKANASLAAAALHAKAAQAQAQLANQPTYMHQLPADAGGNVSTISTHLDPNKPYLPQMQPYNDLNAAITARRAQGEPVYQGDPDKIQPAPVLKKTPALSAGSSSASAAGERLKPAERDTGSGGSSGGSGGPKGLPAGSVRLPSTDKTAQTAATQAVENLRRSNSPAVAILEPKGTTVHTMFKDSTGQYWIQGNDGNAYPLRQR
jgi:hypothetical protein